MELIKLKTTIHSSSASLPFLLALTCFDCLCTVGCMSSQTAPAQSVAMPSRTSSTTPLTCPISGEIVSEETMYVAYFSVYPVYCASLSDSTQLGSMPLAKRAKLCAPQVLAQKQITNSTCPLTGSALSASAIPVTYENQIIGFDTAADANQFKSLPKAQQRKIIDKWRAVDSGSSRNTESIISDTRIACEMI